MAAQFACHAVYGGVLPVYLSLPMSATSCICFATSFHSPGFPGWAATVTIWNLDQCQVSSRPGVALICLFTLSVEMSWNWIEWGGWLPLNLNICFWVNLHYELRAVFTKPLIFFCNPPLSSSWWATHHSNVPVTCNTGPLYHWTTVPL